MAKHVQAIRRQFTDELFGCVWPFCGIGAKRVNILMKSIECAKFRGSRAIVVLICLMPSCHRAFAGISWVWNFFLWVLCGSKLFLVGIRASEIFSRGFFVRPNFFRRYTWSEFFLVGISWVQLFFLVIDFVIQRFSVAGCISKSDKNRNAKMYLNPRILF